MTVIATALKHMLAAGMPADAIVAAVAEMEAGLAALAVVEPQPSKGALRQRRYEERKRQKASEGVRSDAGLTEMTENVIESPAPNKAPQTPKINPTPHGGVAGACEPTHEGPVPGWLIPDLVTAQALAYLAALNAGREAALNTLWNGTPPPKTVTDETWSGWLAHRKAMPKAGKFTPYAYRLFCERLEKLSADTGMPPGDLIDLAIVSNWQTVHPPKDARNDNAPRHPGRRQPGRFRDPLLNVDPADIGLAG